MSIKILIAYDDFIKIVFSLVDWKHGLGISITQLEVNDVTFELVEVVNYFIIYWDYVVDDLLSFVRDDMVMKNFAIETVVTVSYFLVSIMLVAMVRGMVLVYLHVMLVIISHGI